MLWTLLALAIVFSLIAYLYEGLMEENGGERRRQLGGKCLVKYVIVLILLTEPWRVSTTALDPIIRDKESLVRRSTHTRLPGSPSLRNSGAAVGTDVSVS